MKSKEKKELEESVQKTLEKTECNDERCPFHGNLSIRGRYFKGIVKKIINNRVIIEFERLISFKKYERFAKAKTKLHAYLPTCMKKQIAVGDLVKIGECRPLSKIMHFVVMEKIK